MKFGKPKKCLIGERFGLLTVTNLSNIKRECGFLWECLCDCGNKTYLRTGTLKSGHTKSCGCQKGIFKHGQCSSKISKGNRGTKLYKVWATMNQRCSNPKDHKYQSYGARGIMVCEEWKDFSNFFSWSEISGYREGLSIDRIDNNMGYYPYNCRWSTAMEQSHNLRNNINIELEGEIKCLSEWQRDSRCLVAKTTLRHRIRILKWDILRALITPPDPKKIRK